MTSQIFNNPQLLKLLEWDKIVDLIQQHSHFHKTVQQRILVEDKLQAVKKSLYHTELFLKNIYEDSFQSIRLSLYSLCKEESFTQYAEKIAKDGICSLSELNEIAKLLEFHFGEYKNLKILDYSFNEDFNYNKTKNSLSKNFLNDFRSFYQQDGEFNYLHHPRLSHIYKQILEKEGFIRKSINEALSQFSNKLQFSSYDIINDRYVIPIRSDSYTSNIGQIVSRSDTGHTLYVEPLSIKSHNYKRLELLLLLDKEINSLTINYAHALKEEYSYLKQLIQLVFYIDNFNTRSQFCHANDFVLPEISDNICLEIKGAFHPLIENCVKNDISLENKKGLIISGPNTGGKTASLKSLTLIALFTKYGLATPCNKAKISFYKEIYYFGNDQQDLVEGLSSFAGEVDSYNSMMNSLKDNSLIVIDEIFNSTSSEEASALAMALFERIHQKSECHILVSTHHQMLKSLIHQDDTYISAHVGFDAEKRQPTYRLSFGSPGGSQALSIFKKLSPDSEITDSIIKRATKLLDKKMISYETLLEKVSLKEAQLLKLEQQNKQINIELKNQKSSMEGVLRLKLEDKLQHADNKIKKVFDKAQRLLSSIKEGQIPSKNALIKEEATLKSELNTLKPAPTKSDKDPYKDLKRPSEFIIGQKYFSTFLKQTITIKSINKRKNLAQVSKGALSISCPLSSLRLSNTTKSSQSNSSGINSFKTSGSTKIEYDCRGMRLEEFQALSENLSAELLSGAIPFVTLIHGHGTGTLKNWLRDFIKNNKNLELVKNTTGNDGETKFQLKD